MRAVWYFFKLIEGALGMACLAIHVRGFLNQNLEQNSILLCCIFCGFTTHALFGHLNLCLGLDASPLWEAWTALVGSVAYLIAALLSMYHAEKDFYFMYLSEIEAPLHPFFSYSKAQGIATLASTIMYMLHACLAFDIASEEQETSDEDNEPDDEDEKPAPLKLVLFGNQINKKLMKIGWFNRFSTQSY